LLKLKVIFYWLADGDWWWAGIGYSIEGCLEFGNFSIEIYLRFMGWDLSFFARKLKLRNN